MKNILRKHRHILSRTEYKLIISSVLLLMICHVSNGQEKPIPMYENVYCYMAMSTNKIKKNSSYYALSLLIDNQSNDSVRIDKFNKYIFHKLDYTRNVKTFYWEFLTISNQILDDIVIISSIPPNNQILGEDVKIVIPPNSTFISDIYVQHSSFIIYPKGYYKLCLYYEKSSKYIAEIILKIE